MTKIISIIIYKLIYFSDKFFYLITKRSFKLYLIDLIERESYKKKNILGKKIYFFVPSVLVDTRVNNIFTDEPETINWINKISSNITPAITENLIFTVSNNGYLFVIEKNKGNIIRITDLFKNYKIKKRKNIKPIGFAIGKKNLYLTNNDGKMIVVDLNLSNIIREEKVSIGFTSKPIIHNKNLFVIRNGSIIKYD